MSNGNQSHNRKRVADNDEIVNDGSRAAPKRAKVPQVAKKPQLAAAFIVGISIRLQSKYLKVCHL